MRFLIYFSVTRKKYLMRNKLHVRNVWRYEEKNVHSVIGDHDWFNIVCRAEKTKGCEELWHAWDDNRMGYGATEWRVEKGVL